MLKYVFVTFNYLVKITSGQTTYANQVTTSITLGRLDSVEWNGGLDWNGMVDWTGMEWWTGLEWNGGLDWTGMEWWNGLEWNGT